MTLMSVSVTGLLRPTTDDQFELVLHRHFDVKPETVWTVLTDSVECGRWMGTWEGDPSSGIVHMKMVAEEGDALQEVKILECRAPEVVKVQQGPADQPWTLEVHLAENGPTTELTFIQPMARDFVLSMLSEVGPGWEYYMDRLVAAVAEEDANEIAWDDYYPALKEPYAVMARAAEL